MGDLRRFVEVRHHSMNVWWMNFARDRSARIGCGSSFHNSRRSAGARWPIFYGLHDLVEAKSYCAHPILDARLVQCVELTLAVDAKSAHEIFGSPDDLKFCSCLTLFEQATPERCFVSALERFYEARRDGTTLRSLDEQPTRYRPRQSAVRIYMRGRRPGHAWH